MSACDTCHQPGACCSGFVLNSRNTFTREDWLQGATDLMERYELPFRPVALAQLPAVVMERWPGMRELQVKYSCTQLGPDGRCTIYDARPETCRMYEPKSCHLCVEMVGPHIPFPEVIESAP